jgi:hypothetical protein
MKNKIFLTLILLCTSLWVLAVPHAYIQKAGSAADYPNADYLVLFDSTQVDVQESGLSYNNMHSLIKIFTKEGARKLNHLTFDYDPLSAHIDIKKARIYRADGTIEEISADNFYDYPAPARMIYWGARKKMINFGHLEPGDAIEIFWFKKGFTYALLQQDEPDDSRYIPPMRGHFYDIVPFWNDQPIKTKVYQVQVPKSKDLQFKIYNGYIKSQKTYTPEKVKYTFTKWNIAPLPREPHMVAMSNVAPKLLMSTSPDWEAKSMWFYGVNEDFGSFESTPELDAKVDELLKDAKNELDSISILNHWVADYIRYSGLSMGEGEGYTLHKAEMTFRDRCGVCKDKAGILIAMLRTAGFESYAAMTMAGSRIEDIPADQFNHSITVVKLRNGEYKLLDPTWIPFVREEWSSREQQQNYLMGLPDGADLMITDVSPPENHYLKIKGKSEILPDGTLKGSFVIDAEGQSDASLRGIFTRSYKKNWDQNIRQEFLQIFPNMNITKITYTDPYGHMEGPMKIEVVYEIPQFAWTGDQEIAFTPVVASNLLKRAQYHLNFNTDKGNRKYAFHDGCSRWVELEETIQLPQNMEIHYAPKTENVDGSAASFEGNYTLEGNQLKVYESIKIKKRVFEANEWDNYRKAVAQQKKMAEQKVILNNL